MTLFLGWCYWLSFDDKDPLPRYESLNDSLVYMLVCSFFFFLFKP